MSDMKSEVSTLTVRMKICILKVDLKIHAMDKAARSRGRGASGPEYDALFAERNNYSDILDILKERK